MGRTYAELNRHPKPAACNGCPLASLGASFARTDGTGRNGVALVGEALGETEAISGKPFQGDAGYQLNSVLHRAGWKRDDFLILNTINCHPPNNYLDGAPYELGAIHHCNSYFEETLSSNPQLKVLVVMGNTAMYKLLGHRGVSKWHGTVHFVDKLAGRALWVVPTLHPSAVLRGGGKESITLLHDLRRAIELAREGKFERSPVDYLLRPSIEQLGRFVEDYESQLASDPATILAADIETNYSSDIDEEELLEKDPSYEITRISFSFKPQSAITLPFEESYIHLVMRLLGGRGAKAFWNGNKFDVPRLRSAGVPVNGLIIDAMDAWHVLRPDLPRGLAYVAPFFTDIAPWKHLNNSDPEYYSCVDSDALIRIILRLREAHRKEKTWDIFIKYWASLEPRLQRMSEIGIGVNEKKRKERQSYYEDIRDNTAIRINECIPEELRPRKKGPGGYRGKPKDVRAYIQANKETLKDEREAWTACGYQQFPPVTNGRADSTATPDLWRWDKLLPFNHNSPDQIKDYIRFKYGPGAIPHNKKTGKDTTGNDELERLAKRYDDPLLHLVLSASRADSYISSFIRPWTPALDGRVHGIFTNTPSTPRLASQNPNLQNFPIRDVEAGELRKMIWGGEGWPWIIECVAPETKILCADLHWRRADELKLGEELIAFDKSNTLRHEQRFVGSVVTATTVINKPRVKVITTQGEIIVAANHPFLARKDSCGKKWILAKDLTTKHQITFLAKPWEYDSSREGGYLAGIFDGEGWVHRSSVGWAQNQGPTHDLIQNLLEQRNFHFAETNSNSTTSVYTTTFAESLRVLGSIRPQRLLSKARQVWEGRRTWGKRTPIATVISVEDIGEGLVIALETSSNTYIANGLFSHNCDYSGIEAILVGWYANDPDYTRIAFKGVHSFLAAKKLGIQCEMSWSDDQLGLALKEAKKIAKKTRVAGSDLYDCCKRTVHGSNYLEGALLLHKTFPEIWPTTKAAQDDQDFYFDVVGQKVRKWQQAVIDSLHETCYVENAWHIKRWLYNAKKWTYSKRLGKWVLGPGDDAKKGIATIPQGSAGMIMRGAILSDAATELLERGCLMLTIHDSLVARARDAKERDWVDERLKAAMEYPVAEIGGMIIKTESKIGPDWGSIVEVA